MRCIMVCSANLNCSRGSKLLVGALGHARKDAGHWINPILRIDLTDEGCHLEAIRAELSPQENVH